jgi:hypothetical protein
MSRTLQFKRYANTVVANTTGAAGEIIIETTNNIVTVHTGSVAGGVRMTSESYVANSSNLVFTHANAAFNVANVASANITFIYGVSSSQNNSINTVSNTAQTALTHANAAFNVANVASANITFIYGVNASQNSSINTVSNTAQTALTHANAAFNLANVSSNNATAAFVVANTASNNATLAFSAANTAAQTVPQNAQTTNYILTASDAGKHLYYTQSANVNLYIPWTSNASFSNGTTIMIVSRTTSSANVIVTPNTGVTMYLAGNTTSASRNVTTYGMATLIQVAANTWMINGTGVV